MLDRYTNSNLVYYKHNGDDEPYDLNTYLKILYSSFPLIKKRKKAAERLPGLPPELEFHVQINETYT